MLLFVELKQIVVNACSEGTSVPTISRISFAQIQCAQIQCAQIQCAEIRKAQENYITDGQNSKKMFSKISLAVSNLKNFLTSPISSVKTKNCSTTKLLSRRPAKKQLVSDRNSQAWMSTMIFEFNFYVCTKIFEIKLLTIFFILLEWLVNLNSLNHHLNTRHQIDFNSSK